MKTAAFLLLTCLFCFLPFPSPAAETGGPVLTVWWDGNSCAGQSFWKVYNADLQFRQRLWQLAGQVKQAENHHPAAAPIYKRNAIDLRPGKGICFTLGTERIDGFRPASFLAELAAIRTPAGELPPPEQAPPETSRPPVIPDVGSRLDALLNRQADFAGHVDQRFDLLQTGLQNLHESQAPSLASIDAQLGLLTPLIHGVEQTLQSHKVDILQAVGASAARSNSPSTQAAEPTADGFHFPRLKLGGAILTTAETAAVVALGGGTAGIGGVALNLLLGLIRRRISSKAEGKPPSTLNSSTNCEECERQVTDQQRTINALNHADPPRSDRGRAGSTQQREVRRHVVRRRSLG